MSKKLTIRDQFAISMNHKSIPTIESAEGVKEICELFNLEIGEDVDSQITFAARYEAAVRYRYADEMMKARERKSSEEDQEDIKSLISTENKFRKVKECESLEELAKVIRSFADKDGMIKGTSREFNAEIMAAVCENLSHYPINMLTREYGIRDRAIKLKQKK